MCVICGHLIVIWLRCHLLLFVLRTAIDHNYNRDFVEFLQNQKFKSFYYYLLSFYAKRK